MELIARFLQKIWSIYKDLPFRDVVDQPIFYLALVAIILGVQLFLAGFLAWLDQRLEAWLSSVGACVIFPHLMLPDVEAEEIESDVSLILVECVGDAALAGLEPQPDSC